MAKASEEELRTAPREATRIVETAANVKSGNFTSGQIATRSFEALVMTVNGCRKSEDAVAAKVYAKVLLRSRFGSSLRNPLTARWL
jgi:hypothetical protein